MRQHAQAIDVTDQLNLEANADIVNSMTVPHVTVFATVDGNVDVYSFTTINPGSVVTLDVDYGYQNGAPGDVITFVVLFDGNGDFIGESDYGADPTMGAGGSVSETDAFLTQILPTAGTYYVAVFPFGGEEEEEAYASTGNYQLQISIDGQVIGQPVDIEPQADTLIGGEGNDTLEGGTGSGLLDGGTGNDTYRIVADGGSDLIMDQEGTDRLEFLGDVDALDLWFEQNGDNLVISHLGTADSVTVADWFAADGNQIEQISAGGGTAILQAGDVNSLISQMAAFSGQVGADPSAVQASDLPPQYQVAVNSVWQASS